MVLREPGSQILLPPPSGKRGQQGACRQWLRLPEGEKQGRILGAGARHQSRDVLRSEEGFCTRSFLLRSLSLPCKQAKQHMGTHRGRASSNGGHRPRNQQTFQQSQAGRRENRHLWHRFPEQTVLRCIRNRFHWRRERPPCG